MTDDRYKRGREKLKVIIQMAVYADFPAALNEMFTTKEISEKSQLVELT
jgi:hypothetical protein